MNKFVATTAEQGRDDMTSLPCTQGQHELTDEEVTVGLSKMCSNEALLSPIIK